VLLCSTPSSIVELRRSRRRNVAFIWTENVADHDSTVGATARFQRNYNGKQPGDPKKAAQAIVQLTQERNPPLRLLLGSDAYAAAEKNDLARLEEARIWKKLSVSTDFETK